MQQYGLPARSDGGGVNPDFAKTVGFEGHIARAEAMP